MKKLLLLILLTPWLARAQDISGKWNGKLKVQGMELRIVFDISMKDAIYSASMDSPDEKAFGIPATATSFKDSILSVEIKKLGVRYQGKLGSDQIQGSFYHAGQSYPLNLGRKLIEKKILFRPQEPKTPFPYRSEEVKFPGADSSITLAGTLTLPETKGDFPAVILITGSGPQNRDEEFMTHKPFLVLADHLTRNGIAVLRYDDRGFGQSTGKHAAATSADFAADVRAAVDYLKTRKEIDKKHIGLIGHSEGGLIAPMVASNGKVAFIVLLAAPGVPGSQVMLKQIASVNRSQGVNEEHIQAELRITRGIFELLSEYGNDRLTAYLSDVISDNMIPQDITKDEFIKRMVAQYSRPWMTFFLQYDPASSLKKVHCPVLAINGEKDIQVAPENLVIIEKALKQSGNVNVTVKEFAGMNHLFQLCKTGSVEEYASIEQTIEPVVLEEISGWILKQIK